MQDYLQQGAELEDFSLLAFLCDTWEEQYTPSDKVQNQPTSRRRGRPPHVRSLYQGDHPKAQSHRCVCQANGHNTLPQIVGPWLPRHDDSSTHDFYCACMLALLKPWQSAVDLKSKNEEWCDAFECMEASSEPWVMRVLAGLQYYYDSKTACESSSQEGEVAQHQGGVRNSEFAHVGDDSHDKETDADGWTATLSDADLEIFKHEQLSAREQAHAKHAIAIALQCGIFSASGKTPASKNYSYRVAMENDALQLEHWLNAMRAMVDSGPSSQIPISQLTEEDPDIGSIVDNDGVVLGDAGGAYMFAQVAAVENTLKPSNVEDLLEDQQQAYDIIDWHLQQLMAGRCPDQLRMIIPGEGGVGKSKTIQMITENFVWRGIERILVKSAYTGIAASVIDGKTLHNIGMIPLRGGKQSAQTMKRLERYWHDKCYLIIDEMSMVSRPFLAKLSQILCRAHSEEELLGRRIYEQFNVVVRLKTQVRVTDAEWVDLLQHVRNG
ncbi:hypothetical protein M404DRAFT_169106, partial [Pisolithus tinctorius Marx 270]